jgi:Protein of unknown function (DUF2652)
MRISANFQNIIKLLFCGVSACWKTMIPLDNYDHGILLMTSPSPVETVRGILILADISGYTRFSRLHFTSLLHAEEIISELMDSILQSAEFPLQVGQLEGDAVLLFVEAPAGREADAARDAARQAQQFFAAFNLRERSLIACDAGCACQACNQIGELRLKAALHFGSFSRREFRGVVEMFGDDIKLVHTLLKVPMQEREHILLTQEFYDLSAGLLGERHHEIRELPVDGKTVSVHVYLPRIDLKVLVSPKGAGPALSARLNKYAFGRMLANQPRAVFNNLPEDGTNLVLYLLEGLNSAVNIIRKNLQRALRRGPVGVTVLPSVLMMVEVKASTSAGHALALDLLESAINTARPPLILNKLEGAATLLYALAENDRSMLAGGLVYQARRMFNAFGLAREQNIQANLALRQELRSIRFRVIFHTDNVAFKKIREFDELAGLPVILIHRLLQQPGAAESELWMTESFYDLLADKKVSISPAKLLTIGELGEVSVRMIPL